ncbi:MAG: condensation domain-containing protein, partial [Chitinophagaceae bacterium]
MKDVVNLILELAEENVNIYLEDSKLKIDTPGGMPLDEIIAKIKPNRDRIIEYLSAARSKKVASIPNAQVQNDYPVSSSQKRLWILSQLEEASVAYNMPAAYVFTGRVNKSALERALTAMIARHEILRTVFASDEEGGVRQIVCEPEEMPALINYYDLRKESELELLVEDLLEEAYTAPFDLTRGPLIRQSLIRLENEKWIFQYTMHHLISDGWSMGVFLKEMLYLYNSYVQEIDPILPELQVQYKDYAVWQQEELQGQALNAHKNYWLEKFGGELPVLELPTDHVRPAIKSYKGDIVTKVIGTELTGGIKKLCQEQGATLFMGLLAAVNTLLHRYTSQEDIIIGSPIAGRDHADLETQIGPYINTLPLRTKLSGKQSFRKLLSSVKETALAAYQHQVYPFDELIEQLNIRKDMSRNPLFDVMVVLQNADAGRASIEKDLGELKVEPYAAAEHVISKFDLLFDFSEQHDELKLGIEYNTAIYNRS